MGDDNPPSHLQDEGDLVKRRLEKLEHWKEQGIEPYALKYPRRDTTADIRERFEKLAKGEESDYQASLAGRIMALRRHGKAVFADIEDLHAKIIRLFHPDFVGTRVKIRDLIIAGVGETLGLPHRLDHFFVECLRLGFICETSLSAVGESPRCASQRIRAPRR